MSGGHACDACCRYITPTSQDVCSTMEGSQWIVRGTCKRCGPTTTTYDVPSMFRMPPNPKAEGCSVIFQERRKP